MDIEDLQGEERYRAVEILTDSLMDDMKRYIEIHGGDGVEFTRWLSRGETVGEIFEAVFAAMPNDYGVMTKEVKQQPYHQTTIDQLTRHI